jgi:diaminohydroxyphosphoribosylaminopyrimidine deaminase/5-amino-6-(5-phosphoribosylamino)uracil reductase
MSLDGRTAMASGESKWITGAAARRDVQKLRAQSGAVVTGIGTVLADDPSLNVRPQDWLDWPMNLAPVQPLRVVVDSGLRTPPRARVLKQPGRALIATNSDDVSRQLPLEAGSAELWQQPGLRVDLHGLMQELGRRQINEVLVEAGPTLSGAFLAAGLVDELIIYQAPTLLGSAARPLLELPLATMVEQRRLRVLDARAIGEDWRWTLAPL